MSAPEVFRLLFLDDSEVQLRETERALKSAGYEVHTALTVRDARRLLPNADLVIIDFHMPEMDGPEALHILRHAPERPAHQMFYLYTTDANAAAGFKQLGFDGAFTAKGELSTLLAQLETAKRMIRMKRFMRDKERSGER